MPGRGKKGNPAQPKAEEQPEAVETETKEPVAMDETATEEDAEASKPNPNFRLELLKIVKQAQLLNGIRHESYERYRQYCTRRVRKLRQQLKFLHARNHFKSKALEPRHITEPRFFEMPLMNAERAWAYGMSIKSEMSDDQPRKRFHYLKRFAKAAHAANELKALTLKRGDTHTQLEAEAYAATMNASYALERDRLQEALKHFVVAKTVLQQLAKIGDAEEEAICEERIAKIEPNLRFCTYRLNKNGKGGDPLDEKAMDEILGDAGASVTLKGKVEALMGESRKKQALSLDDIEWQGKRVPVKSEKLKLAFLEARHLTEQIASSSSSSASKEDKENKESKEEDNDEDAGDKAKMALYSRLFSRYEDALTLIRQEMKDLSGTKVAVGKADEAKGTLMALQNYATFNKQKHTVARNWLMAEDLRARLKAQDNEAAGVSKRKAKKPEEIIVIYDRLLAALTEMSEVLGGNTADPSLTKDIEVKTAVCKIARCYYLAESYRRASRFAEAHALFGRVADLATAVPRHADKAEQASVAQLVTDAAAQKAIVHASALLDLDDKSKELGVSVSQLRIDDSKAPRGPSRPLLDRLDEFEPGSSANNFDIVNFPPQLQAIPAKPILFDLAFNYIDYDVDAIAKRIKGKAAAPKQAPATTPQAAGAAGEPAQKGGFFSRLWGR